jgi:hypothetical protein
MKFNDWVMEVAMAALVQTLYRLSLGTEVEALKLIAELCGAGLPLSIVLAIYGLHLIPGFF